MFNIIIRSANVMIALLRFWCGVHTLKRQGLTLIINTPSTGHTQATASDPINGNFWCIVCIHTVMTVSRGGRKGERSKDA